MSKKDKKDKKEHSSPDQIPDFKPQETVFDDKGHIEKKFYLHELTKLQLELVKMQYWIKQQGLKVVIIFEGRDAAGKGGMIKRIAEALNPRGCRVVALDKPSDKEKTCWYFQRYVAHLPSAGEIVIFDRSWYNRSGVEKVFNFCTEDEYQEFLKTCPEFEKMIIRSGIILLKYWFSVSESEQEKRLQERSEDPSKRWKLSPIDLESYNKWTEYSKAKDEMFNHTNTSDSPWFDVLADDKKKARLNCIAHILSKIKYEDVIPPEIVLPQRRVTPGYTRPPIQEHNPIPEIY
jgi:polyphosphate kinase